MDGHREPRDESRLQRGCAGPPARLQLHHRREDDSADQKERVVWRLGIRDYLLGHNTGREFTQGCRPEGRSDPDRGVSKVCIRERSGVSNDVIRKSLDVVFRSSSHGNSADSKDWRAEGQPAHPSLES